MKCVFKKWTRIGKSSDLWPEGWCIEYERPPTLCSEIVTGEFPFVLVAYKRALKQAKGMSVFPKLIY